MKNSLITIITITYNAGKFLEKTILSVLNQTNKNFEYILVDGNSKDNTLDIIKQYESYIGEGRFGDFPAAQYRWISEPDKGLYDAMNKGMKMAKGEFLWFINAGDKIYNENTIGEIYKRMDEEDGFDVIYGQSLMIDEKDIPLGERHKIAPKVLTKRSLLNGLVVCHQSIIVRKNIAPDYDLQYKISADYDWTVKVLEKSRDNLYINNYISKFMIAGLSAQQRKKSWIERYRIMKKHFGICPTLWAHFVIILKYPFTRKY